MASGSTLNLISSPGNRVRRWYSIILPSRILGSIEATIKNIVTEARIVHASLKFGLVSDKAMSGMAPRGAIMTQTGVIDSIISTGT